MKNKTNKYGLTKSLSFSSESFKKKPSRGTEERGNAHDEEEIQTGTETYLGYSVKSRVANCFTVYLDEDIEPAKYYRQVHSMIVNATEDDLIEFYVLSPGGYLNGLLSLMSATGTTRATTSAIIAGECHSAASMFCMMQDSVQVLPHSSMLVHFVSYGVSGKGTDIMHKVTHSHAAFVKLFTEVYQYFLTDEEIEKCIGGLELWLDSDEINRRMKIKYDMLNKLAEEDNTEYPLIEEIEVDTDKPKTKTKKK